MPCTRVQTLRSEFPVLSSYNTARRGWSDRVVVDVDVAHAPIGYPNRTLLHTPLTSGKDPAVGVPNTGPDFGVFQLLFPALTAREGWADRVVVDVDVAHGPQHIRHVRIHLACWGLRGLEVRGLELRGLRVPILPSCPLQLLTPEALGLNASGGQRVGGSS